MTDQTKQASPRRPHSALRRRVGDDVSHAPWTRSRYNASPSRKHAYSHSLGCCMKRVWEPAILSEDSQ
eukprot:6479330-Pyramimonas_sp.AAC.1